MIRVVNVRGKNSTEERAAICYVGRVFAGWPGHPLANPYKPRAVPEDETEGLAKWWHRNSAVQSCLSLYRDWLANRTFLESDLKALWEQTGRGAKPLGCWCVNAIVGDGQPIVCHAQILAAMLHERFCKQPEREWMQADEPTGRAG